MIKLDEYPILNNMDTLKRISKDKNGVTVEYMTYSQVKAINFDKVKEEYAKAHSLSTHPKSNDALYVAKGETDVFIEFKNGYIDNGKVKEIKEKIYDSLLLLNDIIDQNISYTRKHLNYILVYNDSKNAEDASENPKKGFRNRRHKK